MTPETTAGLRSWGSSSKNENIILHNMHGQAVSFETDLSRNVEARILLKATSEFVLLDYNSKDGLEDWG
jgi:hypothetical protein